MNREGQRKKTDLNALIILKTRKTIFSFFVLALFALPAFSQEAPAQSTQQLFDRANNLYQRHRYDSASLLYQQLVHDGYNNAELYYNAGNANYKARHLGYAVYYFEKALQQSPGNAVIAHNLALAKQQASDKIDQVPTLFFIRWWHGLLHLHQPNGWMVGSILLFWVVVFLTGWRLLRKPAPRWTGWILTLTAILFCIYLSGAIGTWYRHTHHDFAIIVKTDQQVKAAPDSGSADLLVIHEGLKVKVTDEVNGWRKIELTNGTEGWVRADCMADL